MHKWFGTFHALDDIELTVHAGERIVICGPSGSGKSTLIRCINRLEEHEDGEIVVNGIRLDDDLKRIDEVRREVGMVFQHFNLFPHLSVIENCTIAQFTCSAVTAGVPRTLRCATSNACVLPIRRTNCRAS